LKPVAFGLVSLPGDPGQAVHRAAAQLGIPCFVVDNRIFEDIYAIPRIIRNLIAATPVGQVVGRIAPRESLVDQILRTELLKKPVWAA
jgi:hypothetical protein